MVCQPYINVLCPGWPHAAPPGAGAPAPPRIAFVTTASTTSGRRVSTVTLSQASNTITRLFMFSSKVATGTVTTRGRQQ